MTTIDFKPYGKTPRLFRDIVITEKIDGTNAGIIIVPILNLDPLDSASVNNASCAAWVDGIGYFVGVQSRNRMTRPGKTTDNYGFAGWVESNAEGLIRALGEGTHFGEWWGHGIQHGYGLPAGDRRFSLFAVDRYNPCSFVTGEVPGLDTVPVLYRGPFSTASVHDCLVRLELDGSIAVPGWDRPEGVIVFHSASRQVFKALLENDELPKGLVPAASSSGAV